MAQSSSNRTKRKYGDKRKAITAANKAARLRRHDMRQARMVARTQALIGTSVAVRTTGQVKPIVGTVTEVLRKGDEQYPLIARRHKGAYLKVRTNVGDVVCSRHRSKPIPDRKH